LLAVNQNPPTIRPSLLNKLNTLIKHAFYALLFGVLQKEPQILNSILKMIIAQIPRSINHMSNLILLEHFPIGSDLIPTHIKEFRKDFRALLWEVINF
jgi:hypothetical protein